jgi:hypothetical protein
VETSVAGEITDTAGNFLNHTGSEVLTAVVMMNSVFWNIVSCSRLKVNRHYGSAFRPLHAGSLLGLLFIPLDRRGMGLRNVGLTLSNYKALYITEDRTLSLRPYFGLRDGTR